ncbi:barstar family protein [[Erwinia] mediterraneensis]|uniref:barstar family protein n=1 Tax=[Erwinia] mediterraneensis TaxID=2161819 RepID=UPI0010315ADD|nr:barstar family protein [[Erwinia] mediterraneensis]
MLTVTLDFRQLRDRQDLYVQLARQSGCPFAFGNNLDALWDWLTGGMALPAHIRLCHLTQHQDPAQFYAVIKLLQEAVVSLDGELQVTLD